MKSTRSTRSFKSFKSERSFTNIKSVDAEDRELEDYLAMACKKFSCPYPVIVKKDYRCDDLLKQRNELPGKYKKITMAPTPREVPHVDSEHGDDKTSSRTTSVPDDDDTIPITTIYDKTNKLVELSLNNLKSIPRVLMQLICVIIPYYNQLTKLSVQKSRLNPYIIYEINKILPFSSITDLCFDGSPLKEANYVILLETHSPLSNLSLSRCNINDDVCKQIASKLHFSMPAEKVLKILNLSSNQITDEGAKHISIALRSNRNLRYLNLADNRISDAGAAYILDMLKDFPMTAEEIMSMRRRYIEYLKMKQEVFSKYLREVNKTSIDETSRKSIKKKKSSATSLKTKSQADRKDKNKSIVTEVNLSDKAKIFASEFMGTFSDPYNTESTKIKDGCRYCIGNMVLCYLNLSYNNLSFLSVKKLQDVLTYQKACKTANRTGLLRVMIEGNSLPIKCTEINTICNLLATSIAARFQVDSSRRQR